MANELFQFTLTDNTSGMPVVTLIEEPIGWDGVEFEYVRLPTHGFVNSVNIEGINFEFRGTARTILKNAFDDYGIEANVTILIERRNNPSESFTTIYEGLMKFTEYKEVCGIDCFVTCGITQTGAYYLFNNRKDQAVDTNASTSFDGTALSAYTWLNKATNIPAKHLSFGYGGSSPFGSGIPIEPMQDLITFIAGNPMDDMFFLRMPLIDPTRAELNDRFDFDQAINAVNNIPAVAYINEYGDFFQAGLTPNFEFKDTNGLKCNNLIDFDVNIDVDVTLIFNAPAEHNPLGANNFCRFVIYLCKNYNSYPSPFQVIPIYTGANTTLTTNTSFTINFTDSYSFSNLLIQDGDYLVWGIEIMGLVASNIPPLPQPTQYQVLATINSYDFMITNQSTCGDSVAELSMVNEVLSRQVEAYTNDEIRVYSEYFGREDSEPYALSSNGCGSLECLSSGLQIRGAWDENGQKYKFNKDFDYTFQNLHQIHNLGYGLEDDAFRAGKKWLRVEPYAYWYNTSVLFTLTDINTIETQYSKINTPSKIIVGYQNWATQEQGGRQDVFDKREYRSNLTRENNSIDLRSELIASDFALEVVRRLFGLGNVDNQYDNETFIVEMKKSGSGYDVFLLDTGATSSFIYSLFTMKNTSLTPARNLMRHINRLTNWTRTNLAFLFKFTDGQANFIAEINQDSQNNCPIEVANTTIAENQDIDSSVIDTNYNSPLLSDKEVDFEYPITCAQYDLIVANPYGLIGFTCGGDTQYGWIKRFTFNPNTSIANFQLYQKWS